MVRLERRHRYQHHPFDLSSAANQSDNFKQEEAGKKRRQSKGGKEKRGNKRKKQKFIDDRDSFTTAPPIQLSQSKDLNMMEIPKLKPDWTPVS